ncbi:MAG: hypothetical protein VYA84_07110 [Planctomycetota bacterium]|nr:hypothetical protein [Planctomycetota bacterium]
MPQIAVPQITVPQTAVPQIAVPQTAVPQTAVPQIGVPQTAVPQTAVPQIAVTQIAVTQMNAGNGPCCKLVVGSDWGGTFVPVFSRFVVLSAAAPIGPAGCRNLLQIAGARMPFR